MQLTADLNVDDGRVLPQLVLCRDPVGTRVDLARVADGQDGVTF